MCGITVFFKFCKVDENDIKLIHLSNKEMSYRGPDEQDIWSYENIILGQVRLSIIGLSNGHQPLFSEDKNLVLVCNGEIYNYKALKKDLINKGHTFSSDSDSEVILHLYEEYEEKLFEKLDGMFAFCLYDLTKKRMLVSRDRSGKKPLYYSKVNNGFVFSSELKVIKKYFLKEISINYDVLRQVQQYSYSISPDETYINGIYKVPFSSYSLITNHTTHIQFKKYYKRVIDNTFRGTYQDACDEIRRLLFLSVEKRLQSDVPVGVLLSAGIDSSAISSIAREMKENVNVISLGYKGHHSIDERLEAKKLSKLKGFIWNEVELDINHYSGYFQEILSILDEPNADDAMFAQWGIYKYANSKGYKVLLSGNGGDELFYGYNSHNNYALGLNFIKEKSLQFPISSRKAVIKFLFQQFLDILFKKKKIHYNKLNLKMELPVMNELKILASESAIPLYRNDWHRDHYSNEIENVYYFLHYAWLTNNCYFLSDKLAMANSIEMRSPFADLDLINFVDTLPFEFKFKEGCPKQLLKDSLLDILPPLVLNRPKSGFTPPYEYMQSIIKQYNNKHFTEKPITYSQLVTDYFAYNA